MAVQLATFPVVTLTANTPAPLSSDHVAVTSVTVSTYFNNVGNVYIGGSGVTTLTGEAVPPGDSAVVRCTTNRAQAGEEFFLDEVYVVSANTGDKVRVNAFKRRAG